MLCHLYSAGRNDIPDRLKRHFFITVIVQSSTSVVDSIYGNLLRTRFSLDETVPRDVARTCEKLTHATIKLWSWCKRVLLPTPTKFHYEFSMREISRVFQGVMHVPKVSCYFFFFILLFCFYLYFCSFFCLFISFPSFFKIFLQVVYIDENSLWFFIIFWLIKFL